MCTGCVFWCGTSTHALYSSTVQYDTINSVIFKTVRCIIYKSVYMYFYCTIMPHVTQSRSHPNQLSNAPPVQAWSACPLTLIQKKTANDPGTVQSYSVKMYCTNTVHMSVSSNTMSRMAGRRINKTVRNCSFIKKTRNFVCHCFLFRTDVASPLFLSSASKKAEPTLMIQSQYEHATASFFLLLFAHNFVFSTRRKA